MTVQLLALYTDPERYNTQCYRQTGRRTDRPLRLHRVANLCLVDSEVYIDNDN